jgi:hypothetical protein
MAVNGLLFIKGDSKTTTRYPKMANKRTAKIIK